MNLKIHLLALLAASLLLPTFGHGRTFTSSDGKTINGEVVDTLGDNVIIKIGTKRYNLPKTRFTKADQTYFEEWEKKAAENKIPRLEVEISPGLNRSNKGSLYDYEKASIDFKIKIENEEKTFDISKAKGTLVVFTENCEDGDEYKVLQKVSMDINVKPGDTWEWQAKEVKFEYDDDGSYKYGYKYHGYIFEVKNAAGNVILAKTMPKKFEPVVAEALKLKVNDEVDRMMVKIERR